MKYAHLPIYISGPLTAPTPELREANILVAERALVKLTEAGFPCVCVHSACRTTWGTLNETLWLQADVALMKLCAAVYVVGDTPFESAGTRLETNEAICCNIPIFFEMTGMFPLLLKWAEMVDSMPKAAAR